MQVGGTTGEMAACHARPPGLVGLVLVGPGPARRATAVTPRFRERLSHAYDSDDAVAAARDTILTATPLSDELRAHIVADSRADSPAARAEWPLRGIAQDITREVRNIDVPVLVVAGGHDRVEPVDVLREQLLPHLARAELQVLPRGGHLMPLEAPAELAAILRDPPVVSAARARRRGTA